MTTSANVEDRVEATGRFTVYSLLAVGFAFPTGDQFSKIEASLLPAASSLDVTPDVNAAIRHVADAFANDVSSARAGHILLFPPISSQDAPGYETGYRGEGVFQQSALLADVAGFYRAHGLRAGGSEKERVDHIVVELEFMAVLARKELLAIREGSSERAEICRETAASFLRDHLGCWAPAFGTRTGAISANPWYAALGDLLATWIKADMAAFDVLPEEMVEGPLSQEPPDDGSCGPCPPAGLGAMG